MANALRCGTMKERTASTPCRALSPVIALVRFVFFGLIECKNKIAGKLSLIPFSRYLQNGTHTRQTHKHARYGTNGRPPAFPSPISVFREDRIVRPLHGRHGAAGRQFRCMGVCGCTWCPGEKQDPNTNTSIVSVGASMTHRRRRRCAWRSARAWLARSRTWCTAAAASASIALLR